MDASIRAKGNISVIGVWEVGVGEGGIWRRASGIDGFLFFEVQAEWGSEGSVLDVEGLSRGTGDEAGRTEEVRRNGMVRTSGEELKNVMIQFVDEFGRRVELGAVVVLGVDGDIVESHRGKEARML